MAAIAAVSSCEIEFDVDVKDREPRMYVQCFPGPCDSTSLMIKKCVPVGVPKSDGADFTIKKMVLTQNGTPLNMIMGADQTQWYTWDKIIPGAALEFVLETEEVETVKATSNIPVVPNFTVERDIIRTGETMGEDYIQFTLSFDDTVTENTKLAVAIWRVDNYIYDYIDEETGETYQVEGTYEYGSRPTTVQHESSIMGAINDAFKIVFLRYRTDGASSALIQGKDLTKDRKFVVATPYEEEDEYSIVVFALSDAYYGYLYSDYQKDNNYLAILGLAPSSFAYTNIAGGFGALGGYSAVELK